MGEIGRRHANNGKDIGESKEVEEIDIGVKRVYREEQYPMHVR